MTPEKKYIKLMEDWAKEVAEWQLRNPDKDWATELFGVGTADVEGGDRPPLPPPKP